MRSSAPTALWAVCAMGLVAQPGAARAQTSCPPDAPDLRLGMLLEKTIFHIDVLRLSVDLRGRPAVRLSDLVADGNLTDAERDSIAPIAASTTCGTATLDFVRDVSLDRFLDAIRASSRAAWRAGLIDDGTYRVIDTSLPDWYRFLDGRGVEDGDRMQYEMRGDTLRIRYLTGDGAVLLDRTDVGAGQRRAVLAGYFAPGSDFRDRLIRSLLDTAD